MSTPKTLINVVGTMHKMCMHAYLFHNPLQLSFPRVKVVTLSSRMTTPCSLNLRRSMMEIPRLCFKFFLFSEAFDPSPTPEPSENPLDVCHTEN
jgi:hypothetical protein